MEEINIVDFGVNLLDECGIEEAKNDATNNSFMCGCTFDWGCEDKVLIVSGFL